MFNSFLPILLESRIDPSSSKGGRTEALEELLLYSLGGCPGAIVRRFLPFLRLRTARFRWLTYPVPHLPFTSLPSLY